MSREIPSRSSARSKSHTVLPQSHAQWIAPTQPLLAINQISSFRWSLEEAVAEYRDLGINSIGLWRPRVDDLGCERARELLRDHGMNATSLSWAGGFTGSNGFSYDEAVADACDAVDMAARLGVPVLRIATGGRNGHTENHVRRIVVDGLREVGFHAMRRKVVLAVQPMHRTYARNWSFLSSVQETLRLIDACRHPAVRLGVALQHVWREEHVLEQLQTRVSDLACVQISDTPNDLRSESDQCQLGHGRLPLAQFVNGLLAVGYRGPFEIDIWSDKLWALPDYTSWLSESISSFRALCEA